MEAVKRAKASSSAGSGGKGSRSRKRGAEKEKTKIKDGEVEMAKERTFLMIKPEAVENGHVGEIIARFERCGFRLVALRMEKLSREKAEKQYEEHRGKDFFESLVSYICSAPVVLFVVEGENAISAARKMVGATDPKKAAKGTIRADFGIDVQRNAIHAADSPEKAEREIKIHFGELV